MIQQIYDTNYKGIIKKLLDKQKTVVVLTGTPTCKNCQLSKDNIKKYKTDKLVFLCMNHQTDFKLEEYYQMEELNIYPKTIIFYGTQKYFREGILTLSTLQEIENSIS